MSPVIFGLGEFAQVMGYHLAPKRHTVHREYIPTGWHGFIAPFEDLEPCKLLIAIGPSKVNEHRERIYNEALERGHTLSEWHSEDANYQLVTIGKHCIIFEGNNFQPFTSVGDNVVLWSGNHIGHHSTIGHHCFITSHCVISGGVEIGNRTFVGVNATVCDHVKVGQRCVIAAGAVVDRDMPDDSVWGRDGLSKVPSSKVKL